MRNHIIYTLAQDCIVQISNLVSICVYLANFISLLVLNLCIYITIRRKSSLLNSSQRLQRDIFIATILVTIVFMFAACHSCKAFISILELCQVISGQTDSPYNILQSFKASSYLGDDQESFWGPKMNVTVAISHFLITFNCSCNFLIYCAKVT